MDTNRLTRMDATTWRIERYGSMRVPAIIYADEALISDMDDKVYMTENAGKVSRERRRLYQKEGREPSPADIAARMGVYRLLHHRQHLFDAGSMATAPSAI